MSNDSIKRTIYDDDSNKKEACSIENPGCFSGYGSQSGEQHIFYRTTSNEYGYYAPDYHTVPSVYYPIKQKFSNRLAAAGMYRNHSLNTNMDTTKYK